MKKLLLLFSLVTILGISSMRAETETVTVDFLDPMLPSGWKTENVYDNPTYINMFHGLCLKSDGVIELPELTKLQSLVFNCRYTELYLQYLQGSQWVELQEFVGNGSFTETTVTVPSWAKTGTIKLRFYIKNGGSTVFSTLTYVTGEPEEPTPTLQPAGIKFTMNNQEVTDNVEVTFGETPYKLPTLSFTTNAEVTIYSSDDNVAAIVNRDVIVMGVGTCTITAFSPENEYYEKGEASYTLVVNEKAEVKLLPAGLKFMMGSQEVTDIEVTLGEAFELPILVKDTNAAAVITSSNEEVATITSRGQVSVVGVGTTVIKAETAENDKYEEGEASYTLVVKEDSGVEGVEAEMAIVKVANGRIEAPVGAQIFSVAGMRVNGENVAAGVYVVRLANGKTVKVMVK